ncbi:Hsp20 family protein [bacterium]|nr:Hsp20 family protein [bacterium]
MNRNSDWIRIYVSSSPLLSGQIHPADAAIRHHQPWGSVTDPLVSMPTSLEDIGTGLGPARIAPLVDIYDRHDALILEADLPGVQEEDIVVELKQNVLKLLAKVRRPEAEGARPLALETTVSIFERSFILSDEFDRESISAEYESGVLTLVLPKTKKAVSRRIAVNPRTPRDDTKI